MDEAIPVFSLYIHAGKPALPCIQLKEEDHKTLSIAGYSAFDIVAQKQQSQPSNCLQYFNSL